MLKVTTKEILLTVISSNVASYVVLFCYGHPME